jgi:hypothetical protein
MFDPHGRFTQFITRADLPKFAAGTAELPRKPKRFYQGSSPVLSDTQLTGTDDKSRPAL